MAQGLFQLFKYRATRRTSLVISSVWLAARICIGSHFHYYPTIQLVRQREKLLLCCCSIANNQKACLVRSSFPLIFRHPPSLLALLSWISLQTNKEAKPRQTLNRSQLSLEFNLKIIRFLARWKLISLLLLTDTDGSELWFISYNCIRKGSNSTEETVAVNNVQDGALQGPKQLWITALSHAKRRRRNFSFTLSSSGAGKFRSLA